MSVAHLHKAKKAKDDEFYTLREDVERIVDTFAPDLRNKVVYCNCDSERSEFVKVLTERQEELGIKEVLHSSTDYRAPENMELLRRCDIVMTNPPFSKLRDYVQMLAESGKDYIFIGPETSATRNVIFDMIKSEQMFALNIVIKTFKRPDGSTINMTCDVFTSLDGYAERYNVSCGYPSDGIIERAKATYIEKYDAYNIDICSLLNYYTEYDRFLVPCTLPYKKEFAELNKILKTDYVYIDGKKKFTRILVERKHD